MDWYETILKSRAKKLIGQAQEQGLGFVEFIKQASKSGISEDPDVQNYAQILRENQLRSRSAGKQTQITGAVGKAMQPHPSMTEPQLQSERTSQSPEAYANQLAANPEVLRNTPAPKTEEQFYGAMGRQQLSPEVEITDINANPQFAFARGQLPSSADELANARLKVQQDAEARKLKQIDKQRDQADLRMKLQDRELAWKYYNAGVNAQKPEFENADNWDIMAQGASKDFSKAEADVAQWKAISKEISKEGSEYFGVYTPEEVAAQMASAETLMRNAKAQREMWAKRADEIRKGAYERGKNISTGSKKTFVKPEEQATGSVAPTPAATSQRESIAQKYKIE